VKILYISYDQYEYDGRGRELIRAAKELGEVTYITRAFGQEKPQEASHILYQDRGYSRFLLFVCEQAKRIGRQDVIFIDNRKGIIPWYLAKKLTHARYVVQDCPGVVQLSKCYGHCGKDRLSD